MSVGRHTAINLVGSIIPMAISFFSVPLYLHLIGTAQYGILAIVWIFLGYFGVFDAGLGRATSYNIARLQDESLVERQQIFWTAMSINTGFGLLGGVVVYLVAHPVFEHLFKMPPNMRVQVMASLPWLAAAVPVGTVAGIFAGALEGLRKFALINTISVAGTIAFQMGPIVVAYFFPKHLELIIATTVTIRFLHAMVFFWFAWYFCKAGRPRIASPKVAKELLSYGSWITVSTLIIPFLATLDKFLIGSYLGVVDVAVYTIPDNLTRRLSVVPGALSRSLFPKISADRTIGAKSVFERSFFLLLAFMTPVTVAGIVGLHLFLFVWVGKAIATPGALVGVILLLGIFFNSLAYLPAMYLQATGRPNLNAKFHLYEIVPHVIFLFLGVIYLKLVGVALAMLFVSLLDTALLFWAAPLNIWRIPRFQMALLFIGAALVMFEFLPWNAWQSYIAYAVLFAGCLVYFAVTAPELVQQFRNLLPRRVRFWERMS